MVKANAYGHGLIEISQALPQTICLGVARLTEALKLRQAGCTQRIILMEGFFEVWELDLILQFNLEIVVHQRQQVIHLLALNTSAKIVVWLKIDSGMHRLGLSETDFLWALEQLRKAPSIEYPPKLMTHFASADDPDSLLTHQQIERFTQLTAHLNTEKSLANSAAIFSYPEAHGDWIRPGLALYGVSPFRGRTSEDHRLVPVMTLTARLMSIHSYQKGEGIGYNHRYHCPEAMPVGMVSIGYGDGYPRDLPPEGTPVLVNGHPTTIIGRVSMDMLAIDLRPLRHYQIGDRVYLWGPDLPIETISHYSSRSPYELLCGVSARVERHYV